MNYAVVTFLEENVGDDVMVSEVPITWLSEDYKICRWPLNNYTWHINRATFPLASWTSHKVTCEDVYDTLEMARKKCIRLSSSEDELGRGMRRRVPVKHHSEYVRECESPPNLEERLIRHFSGKQPNDDSSRQVADNSPDQDNNNAELNTLTVIEHGMHSGRSENSFTTNSYEDILLEKPGRGPHPLSENSINRTNVFNMGKGSKLTPDEKFDKIINMLGDVQLALREIMAELSKQPQANIIKPSIEIEELLPIKSFADLQIFEERLKETEFKLHLINFLKAVGGMSGKDLHNRCMKRLFTNDFAEKCSWKGFRNNVKLEDLSTMRCFYDAINDKFRCTEKEFEIMCRDWLRHSKQRRERAEKAKTQEEPNRTED